jgi:hypothetical protein
MFFEGSTNIDGNVLKRNIKVMKRDIAINKLDLKTWWTFSSKYSPTFDDSMDLLDFFKRGG